MEGGQESGQRLGGTGNLRSGDGRDLENGAQHEERDGDGGWDGEQAGSGLGVTARGWDSVVVGDSDVVACGGNLPERYVAGAGETGGAAEGTSEGGIEGSEAVRLEGEVAADGDGELGVDRGSDGEGGGEELVDAREDGREDGSGVVFEAGSVGEITADCGSMSSTNGDVCAKNEPNLAADVCIAQNEENFDVPTISGDFSGLDSEKTNPILETNPNSANGLVGTERGDVIEADGAAGTKSPPDARGP